MDIFSENARTAVATGLRPAWLIAVSFLVAAIVVVLPLAPPLLDYPNHLARIWLLGGGAEHGPLAADYAVDWSQASTNILADRIGSWLCRFLPFAAVDRLLRLALLIGPSFGALVLAKVVHGRVSAWQLVPLLFAWTTTSLLGFLAFHVSLMVALLGAAAVAASGTRPNWRTLAIHIVASWLALLAHPFGLAFYMALIAGLLIGMGPPWSLPRLIRDGLVFAVPPALILLWLTRGAAHPPALGTPFALVFTGDKAWASLISPFRAYDAATDLWWLVPVVLLAAISWASGQWRAHAGLLIVALLLLPLAAVMPQDYGDASSLDRRFPVMVLLMLSAALTLRSQGRLVTAAMALACLARSLTIGAVWLARDGEAADLLAVTQAVKPGEAIVVLRPADDNGGGPEDQDGDFAPPAGRMSADGINLRRQLPALLVPWRQAFIPTLFAIPGQQPLTLREAREDDAVSASLIPVTADLTRGGGDPYLARWRCDFDLLLYINADEPDGAQLPLADLTPVAARPWARLYRIRKATGNARCGPPNGSN